MHIAVVGAGLSGLFASILAARRGAHVTLVAEGHGGLILSHGGIEIWASSSPSRALPRLRPTNPYKLVGLPALRAALDEFRSLLDPHGYIFTGSLSGNLTVLTATGEFRKMCFAPNGAATVDQLREKPFSVGAIAGLRDYYPTLIAHRASAHGLNIQGLVELPMIDRPTQREIYALDVARLFDRETWRHELLRTWKPKLSGVTRLLLPACLGLNYPIQVREDFFQELGCLAFEVPLFPPSVPGLRIEQILKALILELEITYVEGCHASGRIDGSSRGKRVAGLALMTSGGMRQLDADAVILASGGVLHGGIETLQDHSIREPIFQLPIAHPEDRSLWTSESPFDQQPYSQVGVRVNEDMRPLDSRGRVMFENLFAAGGILSGSDRTHEGSRQGIDLATAYRAVEAATEMPLAAAETKRSRG